MCLKIQDLVVLDLLGGEHPLWSRVPLQRELSPFSLTVPYGRCPEIPKYQSRLEAVKESRIVRGICGRAWFGGIAF